MTATQILDELSAHGGPDRAHGELLIVKPSSALTPGLRAELKSNKQAIILELRWNAQLNAIRRILRHLFNNDPEEWTRLEAEVERRIRSMVKNGVSREEAQREGEAVVLLEWVEVWEQNNQSKVRAI